MDGVSGSNTASLIDLDAERSVLGSLLIDKDAIVKISDKLITEDFAAQQHQYIYTAVQKLYEQRKDIDVLTLTSELKAEKHLDEAGGPSYITELTNYVPTAAHVETYARLWLIAGCIGKTEATIPRIGSAANGNQKAARKFGLCFTHNARKRKSVLAIVVCNYAGCPAVGTARKRFNHVEIQRWVPKCRAWLNREWKCECYDVAIASVARNLGHGTLRGRKIWNECYIYC